MRFKKIVALLLAAIMVFCFAACDKKDPDPEGPVGPDAPDDPKLQALHLTLDEWPVIDGALAMIPYYEEMAARILDMPIEEARKHVLTNNTPQAYKNLAEGTVDMVFCAPPSSEQIAYCKEHGVEIDYEQVLNSGFVFFVNKDNPVSNLSKQQLHDIYAGKITNWKEVGGKDELIIAYQRGDGSGSQTGLYEHVIPQYEIMNPPTEQKIGAMAEIIDAVANFDNASGALGFSYYYYVTNMHYQDDVKLIAVDNIYPTADTITSDMYPFISKTSVFFNKNAAEDSSVRKIAEWCHGSDGVQLAQDLGYVPSGDAATVFTGYGEAVKNKTPQLVAYANNFPYEDVYVPDNYEGQHTEPVFTGIKNKAIADMINADIHSVFQELLEEGRMPQYRGISRFDGVEPNYTSVWYNIFGNFNNILSMNVILSKSYEIDEYYYYVNDIITRNYDLNTGRQIKLGDLFADKENGLTYINTKVFDAINNPSVDAENGLDWYDESTLRLAAPFKGVKEDQKFTINGSGYISLYFDYDTPEFYLENQAAIVNIPANDYTDFSKFASKQSLFEDESSSPFFLYQNDQNQERRVNKGYSDYKELRGDYEIYINTDALYYEDMTDYQKRLALGDDEMLRYYVEMAKSTIDQYNANGYKEPRAFVSASSLASEIGGYVTIAERYSYSVYAADVSVNVYYDSSKLHTFKAGSDEELILHDIFKPGVDIKSVLVEAFIKALDNNVDGKAWLDYPGSDAFVAAMVDAIRGFCICDSQIQFQFDDPEAIVARFLPELNEYFRSYASTYLQYIDYADIGYENLNLF